MWRSLKRWRLHEYSDLEGGSTGVSLSHRRLRGGAEAGDVITMRQIVKRD